MPQKLQNGGDPVPEISVGGKRYCLVPRAVYVRLTADAARPARHPQDFTRESIGSDLRRRRRRAGLTQSEVAVRAGIRLETLSRLENGRGNPTLSTLRAVIHAIGVCR